MTISDALFAQESAKKSGAGSAAMRHALALGAAIVALSLQIVAIHGHSLSGDGAYHLIAGHQALRHGTNTVNLEHPPLAKLVFALPTLLEEPLAPPISVDQVWGAKTRAHSERGLIRRVTIRGRYLSLLLFGLPLLGASYLLGARSGGRRVGVLLALTLALSFSVVGNLTVLQTDVAVSLAFVLTVLTADSYVARPGPASAMRLGAAWGLGLAVKFSAVLLGATVVAALALAARRRLSPLGRLVRQALLIFGTAFACLHLAFVPANLGYSREAGRAAITAYTDGRGTAAVDPLLENARESLLALERVDPYLAQWTTGLLAVNSHNSIGVYPSYAFGEVSSRGRWWYHPVVLLLKTPLAVLAAALVGCALWVRRRRAGEAPAEPWSSLGWLSLVTVGVYLGVAVVSTYNLGFRHLLPVLPFLYLPVARGIRSSRYLGSALVVLLALEALATAPLWASQTNTWWLRERNPTRFALSHGNLDFFQNYVQLERLARRRGLGELGVVDPRVPGPVLATWIPAARLVVPGEPLPSGWYAVNIFVEQLVPAVLRDDVDYLFNLEEARALARVWRPLWLQIAAGEDHGYVAGTFHLYRIP